MGVMQQPVEKRACGGGVAEQLVPVLDGAIGGQERRGSLVADLNQAPSATLVAQSGLTEQLSRPLLRICAERVRHARRSKQARVQLCRARHFYV